MHRLNHSLWERGDAFFYIFFFVVVVVVDFLSFHIKNFLCPFVTSKGRFAGNLIKKVFAFSQCFSLSLEVTSVRDFPVLSKI